MTILREEEHRALSLLTLTGSVADLGGDARSSYHRCLKGGRQITTVNLDPKAKPDVTADLEELLPMESDSFDGVLLMNVIEHVYGYQQLLSESVRILRSKGTLVIAVPYVFPYHASPKDYFRFSKDALQRALADAGFTQVAITALGSGVVAARFLMIERLIPGPLQRILGPVLHPLVRGLDGALASLARATKKQYRPDDYALGFVITAMHE